MIVTHTPVLAVALLLPTTVYTCTCIFLSVYVHTHYHITVHVLVPLCIHYLIKPLLCFGTVLPSYITHTLVWSAGNIESPYLGVCLACELHHPKHWGSAEDSVVWGREYWGFQLLYTDCVVTGNVVKEGHLLLMVSLHWHYIQSTNTVCTEATGHSNMCVCVCLIWNSCVCWYTEYTEWSLVFMLSTLAHSNGSAGQYHSWCRA